MHFDHLCSHELLGTDELVYPYLISSEAFFDRFVKLRKNFVKNIFVKLKKKLRGHLLPIGSPSSILGPTNNNQCGGTVCGQLEPGIGEWRVRMDGSHLHVGEEGYVMYTEWQSWQTLDKQIENNTVMAKKLGMFTLYVAVLLKIEWVFLSDNTTSHSVLDS